MTVAPFASAAPAAPTPAGKAGRAGRSSAEETDTTTEGLDAFLATLSTALAAVAQPVQLPIDGGATPSTPGTAESLSALATKLPHELPGSGGGTSLPTALPGTFTPGGDPALIAAQSAAGSPLSQATTGSDPAAASSLPTIASSAPGLETTPVTGSDPASAPATHSAASAPLPGASTGATDGDAAAIATTPTADGSPLGEAADQPADPAAGPSAPAVTGATPATPTAPGAGATTSTGKTTAVLRQVFPEVTRVAAHAGPGTHRLSITLNPDNLGEVKVTLVVRAGAVHVHLAPESSDAHHALLQGAPELHRLLEVTNGDARVVVRDGADAQHDSDQRSPDQRSADQRSPDQRSADQRSADQRSADQRQPASHQTAGEGGRRQRPRGEDPTATTVDEPQAVSTTTTRGTRPAANAGRLDRLM